MDFEQDETMEAVRDTVRRFVREELIPLEPGLIRREAERGYAGESLLPPDVETRLNAKTRLSDRRRSERGCSSWIQEAGFEQRDIRRSVILIAPVQLARTHEVRDQLSV